MRKGFIAKLAVLAFLLCSCAPAWASGAGSVICGTGPFLLTVASVNVGVTGDTTIAVPCTKYVVRRVTLYGASGNIAATTATLGLYTAASAGGATVITAGALSGVTGATVVVDFGSPALSPYLTAATLYLHVVQGVTPLAGTLKVVLEAEALP